MRAACARSLTAVGWSPWKLKGNGDMRRSHSARLREHKGTHAHNPPAGPTTFTPSLMKKASNPLERAKKETHQAAGGGEGI